MKKYLLVLILLCASIFAEDQKSSLKIVGDIWRQQIGSGYERHYMIPFENILFKGDTLVLGYRHDGNLNPDRKELSTSTYMIAFQPLKVHDMFEKLSDVNNIIYVFYSLNEGRDSYGNLTKVDSTVFKKIQLTRELYQKLNWDFIEKTFYEFTKEAVLAAYIQNDMLDLNTDTATKNKFYKFIQKLNVELPTSVVLPKLKHRNK